MVTISNGKVRFHDIWFGEDGPYDVNAALQNSVFPKLKHDAILAIHPLRSSVSQQNNEHYINGVHINQADFGPCSTEYDNAQTQQEQSQTEREQVQKERKRVQQERQCTQQQCKLAQEKM